MYYIRSNTFSPYPLTHQGTRTKTTRISIQNSIIKYTTTMPSNRAIIDANIVQKTQYKVPLNKTAKTPPPKPWPLPKFEPLYITNWDDYSLLNLPPNINIYNPFKLFSLFFIDKIIDKLIEQTNKHVELYPLDKDNKHLRLQQLICKQELYAYFIVQIYIGITIELYIKDYQKDLTTYSTKYIVKRYIEIVRFQ